MGQELPISVQESSEGYPYRFNRGQMATGIGLRATGIGLREVKWLGTGKPNAI